MRRLLLVSLALVLSTAVYGQPQPPQLTWVRFYTLGPNGGHDLTASGKAQLDSLLAAKKIVGWGVLQPVSRVGEEWTDALFVTVQDWKALEAVTTAVGAMKEQQSHDVVIRHIIQSGPPKAVPRFAVVNYHPIIRGRDSDAYALFSEWAKPVFEKLEAAGKVGPWGLSAQNVVLDNKWTYMVWYFMSDLSALDDITTELAALGPARLGTYERRLREMSEDDYIGQLMRVVHWSSAATP